MKTILVTGGAGFIGSHTCVELISAGYAPVIIDNFSNSDPEILPRINTVAGVDIPCINADVRNGEALDKLMSEYAIDAVIHFAGYKAVGESVSEPVRYYKNNLDCTLSLLEAMKRHGVKSIIYSSSATVYSETLVMPLTEENPLGCTSPYGWSKFMCERMLFDASAADPELSVVILRYFNPAGAHPSGLIGESPSGIPNNLMPYIVDVACGILPKLQVYGDDYPTVDGTGVRDYIHICDLARAHVHALEYALAHTGTDAINIGTGRGTSVLELVHAFTDATGIAIPYQIEPRRPGDVAFLVASNGKAKEKLGFSCIYSIEDECRDALRFANASAEMLRGVCAKPAEPVIKGPSVYTPETLERERRSSHACVHKKSNTVPAWLMSLVPLIYGALIILKLPFFIALTVSLMLYLALYLWDKAQFRSGELGRWGWTSMFVTPLYLFLRAARVDKAYAPAIVYSAVYLIVSAATLITSIVNLTNV